MGSLSAVHPQEMAARLNGYYIPIRMENKNGSSVHNRRKV